MKQQLGPVHAITEVEIRHYCLWIFTMLTWAAPLLGSIAAESSYSLSGTFDCHIFQINAKTPPPFSYSGSFTALVAHAKWIISVKTEHVESATGKIRMPREVIASSDGQSIYQVSVPPPPPEKDLYFKDNRGRILRRPDILDASVENGPTPRRLRSFVRDIWLTTASGYYFANALKDNLPPPWAPPEDDNLAGTNMGVTVSLSSDIMSPSVPTEAVFQNETLGDILRVRVTERRNTVSLQIPKSAVVESLAGEVVVSRMKVRVTNMREMQAADVPFIPELAGQWQINDYRFVARTPPRKVPYSPGTNWLSYQDAERIYGILASRSVTHHLAPKPQAPKSVFLIILVALIFFPPAFVVYRKRRRKES